jgi:hypothetical protein
MRLTSGRTINYALGLIVGEYQGIREVSHSGSTAGYQTFLTRFPEQHVSVAVWCNYAAANPASLAHQVADLVLTRAPTVAQASAMKVEVPATAIARWAGTYRDPHTDQTLTFTATEAGLTTAGGRGAGGARGNVTWATLGRDRFASPQGEATFSGVAGHRTLNLVRADADTARFDEVRAAPTALRLNDYVGSYASDELDVRFAIVALNGKLVLLRRPYERFELQPVYPDDFQAGGGGGLGTLRFARNAKGKVTGFSFFAGRVLDVRFTRVPDRGGARADMR